MSREMEARTSTEQVAGEAVAQISKTSRRKRRTKEQMIAHRSSKRSLAHQKRWHDLSDEHKQKMLENLAKGRKIRGDKYNTLKIRNS